MMSLFMPHVVSQRRNTLSVVKLYKSYKHFLPSFLAQHLSSSVYPPLDDVYDVTFTCLVCLFFFTNIAPKIPACSASKLHLDFETSTFTTCWKGRGHI